MLNFALQGSDDRALYEGPHGPMTMPGRFDSGRVAVATPQGEASIAWSPDLADDVELEGEGIAVQNAGVPSACLRRAGRVLTVTDDDGTPRAVVRQKRFGRVRLERPDGVELATWHHFRGRVTDDAEFADVALMLLVMASRGDRRLDRPALTL
jgi:hypothetical protein